MNRTTWMVRTALAGVGLAVVLAAVGCGAIGGGGTSKPTLQQYFDADSKTADFKVVTLTADGKGYEMTGTVWVDGRKFRYDLYDHGKFVRSIMSPDGKTAYFAQNDKKVSEPSVASVDHYLLEFGKPPAEALDDGIDEETGAQRILYSLKKTENLEGSANAWYTEDIVYLVKDDEVIGVITRGDTPNQDGTYDLDTFRRIFSNLKVGVKIPAEKFELPYPIKTVDR